MEIQTTELIMEKTEDVYRDDIKYSKFIKKKWVAVDDEQKRIQKLEDKRITDNNNYISIPIKDWLKFKKELCQK